MQFRQHSRAILLLLLLGITWGTGFTLVRFAMTHNITPLAYATWQAIGPAIILFLLAYWQLKRWPIGLRHILFCVVTGVLVAIPNVNMALTAQHLPSSIVGLLSNTSPLFVLLMLWLLRSGNITRLQLGSILLLVIGLVILQYHGGIQWKFNIWYLTALISPLCFAACAIYIAKAQPADLPILPAAAGTLIATTCVLLPLTLFRHEFLPLWQYPLLPSHMVIYAEMLLSSLGYVVLFALLRVAGAIYYCFVDGVVACVSVLWGVLFLHEVLHGQELIAMACILVAIFIGNMAKIGA